MNIETLMKELPPAPDDVVDWIRANCVKKTYIFYSRKKRKAVCSRCGAEYEINKDGYCPDLHEYLKHDIKLECPTCWHSAITKAAGLGCNNLEEFFRVVVFVKKNKSLYASLAEVVVDFTDIIPKARRSFTAMYKFNKAEQVYFRRYWNGWECRSKNIKLPTPATSMGWSKFDATYLYDKNFDTVFNIPALKYADVKDVYKEVDLSAYGVIEYIRLAMKYRSLELLRKAGYKNILKEKIIGTGYSRACNWKATSLEKILRVKTKGQAKEIRAADLSLNELMVYQRYCKAGRNCPAKFISMIDDFERGDYHGERMAIIEAHIDVVKAAQYIFKQKEIYEEEDRHVTLRDYSDYLQECEKLGYNLSDKHTLKPNFLLFAHEKTANKLMEVKDKADIAEFTKNMKKITGMTEPFIRGNLMIRPATSQAELRSEGQSLGHCVGGYSGHVINGTSAILFIRKTDKPGKSFYTLELSSQGNVIQCRGKGNRSMTEEVKIFVELWMSEVINKKKKAAKKEKAA